MITSILEYLESSASRYPDKTAFADLDATCTFEELRLRARRVGTALAEHFAPRNPVPVFMEKSVDTIGMFMGAVYAGCFYVLLDTKQPAARISQILDILDSNVIVTSSKYQKDLEKLEFKGTILLTEELEKNTRRQFCSEEYSRSGIRYRSALRHFYIGIHRSSKGCCCGASFCN
mgnify:FL=1